MYLRKVHIQNIRCIADYTWEVNEGEEAGWHVLIGDNGSGKSAFLQSIALTLIGDSDAQSLLEDWRYWLMDGKDYGDISLTLVKDKLDIILQTRGGITNSLIVESPTVDDNNFVEAGIGFRRRQNDRVRPSQNVSYIHFYNELPGLGWFAASYGPFRRFKGGDNEQRRKWERYPRIAAHLSVFGESTALTDGLEWLIKLDHKRREGKQEGSLLGPLIDFINQKDFLPNMTRLQEVSSDGVKFIDGNGVLLPIEELSDGFRSILSLTFDLVSRMAFFFSPEQIFSANSSKEIICPGVVLIDEVDAHLHPSWQRNIGPWFKKHFPNIQFIVTTHSPLVCQAATTVWRLPRPGSDDKGGRVTGIELDRLLYGNVLDAYGTELFGDASRSDAAKEKLKELAELNIKELDKGLTEKEKRRQESLRAAMPTAGHTLKT